MTWTNPDTSFVMANIRTGAHGPQLGPRRPAAAPVSPSTRGGPIRITGYSLLAVGAVALTLLLARRPDVVSDEAPQADDGTPAVQELDAIRSAGF